MKIQLVTTNDHKVKEAKFFLKDAIGIEVIHFDKKINELQIEDVDKLVEDKVLKAFNIVGRPVFVEHTCLYIDSLNKFPGGLTQLFWDKLEEDKFSQILGNLNETSLTAKTVIAYCDAKKIHRFEGQSRGKIAPVPRGDSQFQWDTIFIPDGYDKTFAEMGELEKNKISMRKIAFDHFIIFLNNQ